MDTNKIEKALLDRELKTMSDQLGKIGLEIKSVFNKYGAIQGDHAEELHKYIVSNVLMGETNYFAGYTTEPKQNLHSNHVPECIKQLVLEWAVKNFFENFDSIKYVVDGIE